jgi:hypothetical protein
MRSRLALASSRLRDAWADTTTAHGRLKLEFIGDDRRMGFSLTKRRKLFTDVIGQRSATVLRFEQIAVHRKPSCKVGNSGVSARIRSLIQIKSLLISAQNCSKLISR